MPAPELVIFDCDGVLVDSEIIAARVEAALITEAGYPIEPETIMERYSGLTVKDMLVAIEQESGVPFQASLLDRMREETDRRLAADVRPVEGAARAVAAVRTPRCVCSNSRPQRIELMLGRTGLLPLFEGHIFSAQDPAVARPKPAPDVFLHAAQSMGADPAKTFVIEDTVHGIAGARAAGMRVIGFTGGAHSFPGHADALTEAGAETVIRRWAELDATLAALSQWSEDLG
ncbi:MAG TPA: HAD family hydrolase [Rhizobiaceae bacterium]|nr:HAD family hydrolase [Rhizobiaceae bacterium]